MEDNDSVIHLHSGKDNFSVALKILSNVGSLIPNKKIDPSVEYGVVVVKIEESSDFLGLGEFVEFHKLILDITPQIDGTMSLCATMCFPMHEGEAPEDEDDTPPDFLKLHAIVPKAGVSEFMKMVREKKFFYAVFSTPQYDGRVVVKHKTGLIAAKAYEERIYKVQ